MILSDRSIKERLGKERPQSNAALEEMAAQGLILIDPLDESAVQPSSVDLRLDGRFRIFRHTFYTHIDPKERQEDLTELVTIEEGDSFILHPGEFILGNTMEFVSMPNDLVGRLEGKSSLGRLGLIIHSTAGYVDPGFYGHLTLELGNVATLPIKLYPGMRIAQISFLQMTTPAQKPYGTEELGSKYKGQAEPTASRSHLNFEV
jgi:dCTP deaminase